jgi:nucleoside 2-deoxyribosyltransferase
MSTQIWQLFEKGMTPSQVIKNTGYPKSTVYSAYKEWLRTRGGKLPSLKVFVSHSIEDFNVVVRMHELLSLSGVYVNVAESEPELGSFIITKINRMIKNCDYVIALLTKKGLKSSFVNYELGLADSLQKPLILLVEKEAESELPAFLKGREYLLFDLNDAEHTIEQVVEYINKIRIKRAQEQATAIVSLVTLLAVAMFGAVVLGMLWSKKK